MLIGCEWREALFLTFKRIGFHQQMALSVPGSFNVRQHLRERVGHHSAAVLRHGAVPHADAAGQRVHPLPPDPRRPETKTGGVLPARLVLHQRHRHERCKSDKYSVCIT